jgi:hypothetical protein
MLWFLWIYRFLHATTTFSRTRSRLWNGLVSQLIIRSNIQAIRDSFHNPWSRIFILDFVESKEHLWLILSYLKYFLTTFDLGVISLLEVLNGYRRSLKLIFAGLHSHSIGIPRRKVKHLKSCLKVEMLILTRWWLILSKLQVD